MNGGGGYSAGSNESMPEGNQSVNGCWSISIGNTNMHRPGGAYYTRII